MTGYDTHVLRDLPFSQPAGNFGSSVADAYIIFYVLFNVTDLDWPSLTLTTPVRSHRTGRWWWLSKSDHTRLYTQNRTVVVAVLV